MDFVVESNLDLSFLTPTATRTTTRSTKTTTRSTRTTRTTRTRTTIRVRVTVAVLLVTMAIDGDGDGDAVTHLSERRISARPALVTLTSHNIQDEVTHPVGYFMWGSAKV